MTLVTSPINKSLEKNGLENLTKNNQEIVKSDYKVLNWTEDKGLHYAPVKYIMRHKVSKEQFKIKTKSGKITKRWYYWWKDPITGILHQKLILNVWNQSEAYD